LGLIDEQQPPPVGRPAQTLREAATAPGERAVVRARATEVDLVLAAAIRDVGDPLAIRRVDPGVLADPRGPRQVDRGLAIARELDQLAAGTEQRARSVEGDLER